MTRETLRGYAMLLAIALPVLALDQVSKALVTSSLKGRPPVPVLGGAFRVDYVRNTGAAFSLLVGGGALFTAVAAAVCVAILVYAPRLNTAPLLTRLALGLVLGGAAGNLIDRLRLGYVVDFIDFRWFPVFNAADSAIVVGVGLLALSSLLAASGDDR